MGAFIVCCMLLMQGRKRLLPVSVSSLAQAANSPNAASMPRSSTHCAPSRPIAFLMSVIAAVKMTERARFSRASVLYVLHFTRRAWSQQTVWWC